MKKLIGLALAAATFASPAHALVVVSSGGTLEAGDPTTTARLFRDGVTSTWAAPKTYPGTLGGGPFVYDLVTPSFAANATQDIYYRITYTNTGNLGAFQPHSTAYANAFDPGDFSANYLGDSGSSPADGASIAYEVIVTAGNALVVHFGEVSPGFLPGPYTYTIEAFSDANGGEAFGVVPEPATWATMIGGIAAAGGTLRRRRTRGLATA